MLRPDPQRLMSGRTALTRAREPADKSAEICAAAPDLRSRREPVMATLRAGPCRSAAHGSASPRAARRAPWPLPGCRTGSARGARPICPAGPVVSRGPPVWRRATANSYPNPSPRSIKRPPSRLSRAVAAAGSARAVRPSARSASVARQRCPTRSTNPAARARPAPRRRRARTESSDRRAAAPSPRPPSAPRAQRAVSAIQLSAAGVPPTGCIQALQGPGSAAGSAVAGRRFLWR
jgi:hypothetical protein